MQQVRAIYDPKFRVLLLVTVGIGLLNATINLWRASHAGAFLPAAPAAAPTSNSQSVTVGSAESARSAQPVPQPQRPWLTTEEVAALEGVDRRTVQDWSKKGLIPAERDESKKERAYRIPLNYERLPAADSRN